MKKKNESQSANELVPADEVTMTSLQIAEVTGKNHKDVMRAIRAMEPSWEKVRGRKFALSQYDQKLPTGGVKQVPCYSLTKTECLYISTKFNDEARARLVLRWEKLERQNARLHALSATAEQTIAKAKELLARSEEKEIDDINELEAYEAAELMVTGMAPTDALEVIGILNSSLGNMIRMNDEQERCIERLEKTLAERDETIRTQNKVILGLQKIMQKYPDAMKLISR